MRIRKDASYPTLYEALEDISHDCGARAGHSYHEIDDAWAPWLDRIEPTLKAMSEDDRQTLTIGDQDEAHGLALNSIELMVAHAIFHDYWLNHVPDGTVPIWFRRRTCP